MDLIKDEVFRENAGARTRARRAVFLIVTQTPTNKGLRLFPAAMELKRRGVEVFVLVVHRYIETMAFGAIASRPYRRHLFHVKEFRSLKQLSEAVKFKGKPLKSEVVKFELTTAQNSETHCIGKQTARGKVTTNGFRLNCHTPGFRLPTLRVRTEI